MTTDNALARVLLVGELNPRGADPRAALYHLPRNAAGNRLRCILGLTDLHYARLAKLNLCSGTWDMGAARKLAATIVERPCPWDVVVLLGRKVARAFGTPSPFYYHRLNTTWFVTLPHPSGRCRAWNDPRSVEWARMILARVAPGIPWGTDAPASPVSPAEDAP